MHFTFFFVYPAVWGAYGVSISQLFHIFISHLITSEITFFFLLLLRFYEKTTDNNRIPLAMVQTMKKLKSGYINGTRVMLGHLGDFLNTSAITDLSFLGSQEDGYPDREHIFPRCDSMW